MTRVPKPVGYRFELVPASKLDTDALIRKIELELLERELRWFLLTRMTPGVWPGEGGDRGGDH